MKALIICWSEHHGNTKKIADAMASVLHSEVIKPTDVDVETLDDYDLIGFGSGIYFWSHHKSLCDLIDKLPHVHKKAFVFSTRGVSRQGRTHSALIAKLEEKGFEVVGEFSCRGFDTYGFLKHFGGIARGRPNDKDLRDAQEFARTLENT
jgi:flavodoxin